MKLIAGGSGPSVFICDECVSLCVEVIEEELAVPPHRARRHDCGQQLESGWTFCPGCGDVVRLPRRTLREIARLYPDVAQVARRLQAHLDDLNDQVRVIQKLFVEDAGVERTAELLGMTPSRVAEVERRIGRVLRRMKRDDERRS